MGETVLCGVVRLNHSPRESQLERLRFTCDRLAAEMPFVYLSGPLSSDPGTGFGLPIITDRRSDRGNPFTGFRRVLRVLRQPVLFVSGHRQPPEPDLLTRLVDRWDRCPDRLSGVFVETESGSLKRFPGLYASPLLSALRRDWTRGSCSFDRVVGSEPIRTVKRHRSENHEAEPVPD